MRVAHAVLALVWVQPKPDKYPCTWTAQQPPQLRRVSFWRELMIYGDTVTAIMGSMLPPPLPLMLVHLGASPHRHLIQIL